MIRTFLKQIITNVILLFSTIIFAQNNPTLDSSFGSPYGFSDGNLNIPSDYISSTMVHTIAVQSDGKILVGGNFKYYNWINQYRIARLNTDGSLDDSFNIGTGFNHRVYTIAIQSDGKILVGGSFTSYNGTNHNGIARLNTDGSLDDSFNIGTGFSPGLNNEPVIHAIAVQADGKIIVGGRFTYYNNQSKNSILRLNTDGGIDTSFDAEISTIIGVSLPIVRTIIIQPDGKILVGGKREIFNSQSKKYIVCLNSDGSLDSSFNEINGTENGEINTISLQSDGKILVGGSFTSYNGINQNRITRLNTNGDLDTSFNIGTGFDNGQINTIAVQPDGKILIGGNFSGYNGNIYPKLLVCLNENGGLVWFSGVNGFYHPLSQANLQSIALQSDGKILVGGRFKGYNSIEKNNFLRLDVNSTATIENIQSADTKLYPNPAEDFINLSSNDTIRKIIITNTSGRIMLTENYNNEDIRVDISHLPKAVYLLTITTDQGKETTKIVKN